MTTNVEIELPEASELGVTESTQPEISLYPDDKRTSPPTSQENSEKSIEKEQDGNGSTGQNEDAESEVVWHYLTFDTPLPHPTTIQPSRPGQDQPPQPPDLTKFIDPFDWSEKRKNLTIWVACASTILAAFSAGSYTPGIGQMTELWNVSSVAALVGITIFTTGFAVAPMVFAPFSEINGRRPVFMLSGVVFIVSQLGCGLTNSYAGMLVARFFVGIGGSTFSTMVGGVVSDIYHTEDRNTPMTLFSGAALFGTGLGPLLCGFIAENTSWRWIFFLQTIAGATILALLTVVLKETRGSVLLSQKAKRLNQYYEEREAAGYYGFNMPSTDISKHSTTSQRIRWKVKADEERASIAQMIGISLYRPFHLLLTEPVVFWFSLWVAFSWAVLYLTLAAIPLVFQSNHSFSLQESNAVFGAMCVASILASIISIYQEKFARRHGKLVGSPEGRLYFACIESACMPIGMFMFGWTSSANVHWIVPSIAIGIATIGIFAIYLSTFNYLADTYHRYASSALAAQSFCRNMLGGAFPLVTTRMYNQLGYGPASSLIGGIATLLTIVPWILVFYGPRIRARSKFASEIMGGQR